MCIAAALWFEVLAGQHKSSWEHYHQLQGKSDLGKEDVEKEEVGKEYVGKDPVWMEDVGKLDVGKEDVGKSDVRKSDKGKEDVGKDDSIRPSSAHFSLELSCLKKYTFKLDVIKRGDSIGPSALFFAAKCYKHRFSKPLFQPLLDRQRIAYNPSLHPRLSSPESANSPVITSKRGLQFVPRISHTSPIEFIFCGGQDKFVIFIWV